MAATIGVPNRRRSGVRDGQADAPEAATNGMCGLLRDTAGNRRLGPRAVEESLELALLKA